MDDAVFERLLSHILTGITLRNALAKERVTPYQFSKALQSDPVKTAAYSNAKRVCGEMWADECVEIADSEEDPQIAANRIKARQWAASKLLPRVYGDKLQLDVTERIDPAALRAEALARLGLRPSRDLPPVNAPQLIDATREERAAPTDTRSEEGMRSVFD